MISFELENLDNEESSMMITKKISDLKPKISSHLFGARGRGRTGTGITSHRILSPGRLPIPPLEQVLQRNIF